MTTVGEKPNGWRLIKRRHQQDADLVDSLLRILESPNPQAERVRQLIKEVANG